MHLITAREKKKARLCKQPWGLKIFSYIFQLCLSVSNRTYHQPHKRRITLLDKEHFLYMCILMN